MDRFRVPSVFARSKGADVQVSVTDEHAGESGSVAA